jgi:hypothetical protein
MKRSAIAWVLVLLSLTGCEAHTRMQTELVAVAREGLGRVEAARQSNADAVRRSLDDQRQRLDRAMEADIRSAAELSPEWVLEATRAYAAGIERYAAAVAAQDRADRSAADNAQAADEALALLERVLRAPLRGFSLESQR